MSPRAVLWMYGNTTGMRSWAFRRMKYCAEMEKEKVYIRNVRKDDKLDRPNTCPSATTINYQFSETRWRRHKTTYDVRDSRMLFDTRLWNDIEVTLRQTTLMMWPQWRRDDGNDGTLDSRSEHNRRMRLRHGGDCQFALRLLLAYNHNCCLDLLTCHPTVDGRFQLAPRQTSRSNSKDKCQFAQRLLLALKHREYFDPLTCLPTGDERFQL